MQFHFTFKTEIKALRTFLRSNRRGSRRGTHRTLRSGSAFGRPQGVSYPAGAGQTWFPVGSKVGVPSSGTRWEGREPGFDPRYSCGWHYRKNKFNKERRQFERMSSFETQAAGLARPRSSPGPHLSIPLTRAPKALLRSPPCPSTPWPREDAPKPPHHHHPRAASARAQSRPAPGCHLGLAAAPPPPRAPVGKGLPPGRGSGGSGSRPGGERGSERCVCERESW